MSEIARRMMMLAEVESEEVKEVGTAVTNTEDGEYGSLTFSVPYSEGIHYYLLEQTEVVTGNSNRLAPAALFRCDYINGHYTIIWENYGKSSMVAYTAKNSSDSTYFSKNEDGTFTYIGSSGFRFNVPLTYHIYHLAEGKV